jgi:hypothetical protein
MGSLYITLYYRAGITGMCHHAQFFPMRQDLTNFVLGYPRIMLLPISAPSSSVALDDMHRLSCPAIG